MPKITVEEAKDLALLPTDSILHLKVDELTIKEVQGRNTVWEKLEIKFKILGVQAVGDGSPVDRYEGLIGAPIWGSVPFKLTDHAENRLRQWAEAILGIELGVGFELDTDLFMGRECRGVTTQYDKRAKDSRGNPFKGHQVDSLLPKAAQQWQQPAQQPFQPMGHPPAQQVQQPMQQQYAPQPQQPLDPWATQQQPANAGGGTGWEEPPF